MPTPVPAFGLADIVPEDALSAWGARLIVTQDGEVDFVYDRQGSDQGPHSPRLFEVMNKHYILDKLLHDVGELLRSGKMDTRAGNDFALHSDDELEVHANTNGSGGYCYVTAWLKPAPGAVAP